ncbi:MAG: EscU/YscU/HrcU family type III secretion system export apparatus switch protein, partial [Planctomycetes bacterium]|nr:EscU/YscU/HrcU family type III secretion system export apparatus switch protein [Planctomycetota bacterium]
MAEKPASERTEEATPERLRKAREEGQVPQSQELPSAILIAALLVGLLIAGEPLYRWCASRVRAAVAIIPARDIDAATLRSVLWSTGASAMTVLAPFLVVAAAGSVLASLVASGWAYAPKAASPKLERISPAEGFRRLFSSRSLMRLLVSVLKLAALVLVVWLYMRDHVEDLLALRYATAKAAVARTAELVFAVALRLATAMAAIAALDLLYQRRKYKKDLRMTRQELKEERRQYELAPELKGRIRRIQIEMVRKRMLQEVPNADVVLANPTHVAAALRYDAGSMTAPVLVAKGADMLAEKIKEIARAHGVPVVHRPQLARSLY